MAVGGETRPGGGGYGRVSAPLQPIFPKDVRLRRTTSPCRKSTVTWLDYSFARISVPLLDHKQFNERRDLSSEPIRRVDSECNNP